MITKLRKKISVFLWFAVAIFVSFIFFQWGMQFAGKKSLTKAQKGIIAEVNGTPISTVSYNNIVRNYMEMGFSEGEAGDSAFYNLVRTSILLGFYEKDGLFPSDEEIIDIIKKNPPPDILRDTSFYVNGNFDYIRYQQILQDPQNIGYFTQYELWLREALPRQRLSSYLLSTVHPTNVINEYMKEKTLFTVEYGRITLEEIPLEFTEQDLHAYYEIHKETFKRPPSYDVKFVRFDLSPSLEDQKELAEEASDIMSQIEAGTSFDTLAYRFSDDINTKMKFGYLGFVKRGELPEEVEKVAFSLSSDSTGGPIKTEEGLYILKCKKRTPDSVELSQIFLRLTPSYETKGVAIDKAFSLTELARERGFEKAAEDMNLDVETATQGSIDGIDISGFISGAKKNTISRPIVRKNGVYVLTYKGKTREFLPPYSEIREEIEERFLWEKTKEMAEATLLKVKSKVLGGESMRDAFKKYGIAYERVKKFTISSPSPGMPDEPKFYGAVWAIKEGDISEPVTGKKSSYIIKCLKRKEPEQEQIKEEFGDFQISFWKNEREKAFDEWIKLQIAIADIKDYRY